MRTSRLLTVIQPWYKEELVQAGHLGNQYKVVSLTYLYKTQGIVHSEEAAPHTETQITTIQV